jgi:hypothetical protein
LGLKDNIDDERNRRDKIIMDSSKQPIKRKRGRPRKNVERDDVKTEIKRDKKDENIVLFLALSDEDTSESEDDNRFTVNESDSKKGDIINPLSDSEYDSESNSSDEVFNANNKQLNVKTLIEEVKKRDAIIAHLRVKGGSVLSSYNTTKPNNIHYHCVQVANADTNKVFVPQLTDCSCWWCDNNFDNLPAYLVNYYRNGIYYVFGNFCSFNCGLKYNVKMLKDFKCDTRRSLTLNLRTKVTGEFGHVKLAGDRESLKSKGGRMTIEKFREGFSLISADMIISMPPMIPLVHVIEEGRRE